MNLLMVLRHSLLILRLADTVQSLRKRFSKPSAEPSEPPQSVKQSDPDETEVDPEHG